MKTAICAIIKDEHRFIEEWIEWHLGLGFGAIHLFEDKDSKSHEEICEKYSNVYLRRYENDEEVQELLALQGVSHRQRILYDWFANNYKNEYDWVAFIDIDEFINFSTNYNLDSLCNEFKDYSGVILNWKMIGASGYIKRAPNIVECYTEETPFFGKERDWAFKCIVNLSNYCGMTSIHRCTDSVNTNHEHDYTKLLYNKAWINHYFTKSWEDWCDRIFSRGDTLRGHRLLSDFFDANPSMRKYEKDLIDSVSHLIPNGTYKLNREGLIAGGNVSKIMKLNGEKSLNPIDFLNKKILLIGNKPIDTLTEEQIAKINSYDVIVRCNGMNNKSATGNRVDWWWLNVWDWNVIKENLQKSQTDYSNTEVIMIDKNASKFVNEISLYVNLPKMKTDKTLIYTQQSSTRLFDQDEYWKVDTSSTVPTTDIVCLSYLLNKYIFSEITITCLDIENREELLRTHPNWCNTWHKSVGGLERDYIKNKVAKGELRILEL